MKKEPYKFKDLKVYGSLESYHQGARKYRHVFDESECRYVNVELSFYNILFDEEDWNTKVRLRAANQLTGEEICTLEKEVQVSQSDNIVYVRDGWGTPDVGWWKKGAYLWEAYIEGKSVAQKQFFITDGGLPSATRNPYFKIRSIKLFESPYEGLPPDERTYLEAFDKSATRYVNIELTLDNLRPNEDNFPLELKFFVYDDSRELKGQFLYYKSMKGKRKSMVVDAGIGTHAPGFWVEDNYTIEIVFMDQLIAVVPFVVGSENTAYRGKGHENTRGDFGSGETAEPSYTFEEAKAELDELIGLEEVKGKINEIATYLRFAKVRQQMGFKEEKDFSLHSIFMGSPGTGKTTVAKMLGKIYKSLGLLETDAVHETGRAELVGEFIGQTAPKVKAAIENARGGILFIDEAYALTNRGDDAKDFGREVIEVLLKEISDGPGNIAIVCAGYTREMQVFLESNPGLASRFKNVIIFQDYTPDELLQIAQFAASKKEVRISPDAARLLHNDLVEAFRNRNANFGNARYVYSMVEAAKQNMAIRVITSTPSPEKLTKEELSTITLTDMEKVFEGRSTKSVLLPVNETLLQEAVDELNALVGLENIKNEVREIVKLVRFYRETRSRDLRESFSLHTVFTGNPGTGKTTVARILVRIYKALGILQRGHLVECDRKSLVAGYVGQTAIKTSQMIDAAMGGGLFIDEAYALTGSGIDFGREAIEVLLKRMEDDRGEFMVTVAGYTNEMKVFLESNPGLKSRFDKHFHFKDYTAGELMSITEKMFTGQGLKVDSTGRQILAAHIEGMLKNKNKFFGNARAIRKIVAEIVRKQHLRLAETDAKLRTDDMLHTVLPVDLEHLGKGDGLKSSGHIGFQPRT